MSEKELLIIDTDGGGDEAAAVMLALCCKDVAEVLGITCIFGNTSLDNVCTNVMRMLTICDETEVPIYRGCAEALIKCNSDHMSFATDGLGNVAREFSTGGLTESPIPASLALIQLAEKYPNRINLIAIGPLTNIAIAHKIDPQFTRNLKSLTIMGGNYKGIGNVTEVAEFNFFCDPESANIVTSETICPVTLVPWETAFGHGIQWDVHEKLAAVDTAKGYFMKRVSEYYVKQSQIMGNRRYYDIDFIAVAALLYPECIKEYVEQAVAVECAGTFTRGQTIMLRTREDENKIKIITKFDEDFLNKLRFKMLQE